eukprot:2773147-Pyramimonas_sp.AAC.1
MACREEAYALITGQWGKRRGNIPAVARRLIHLIRFVSAGGPEGGLEGCPLRHGAAVLLTIKCPQGFRRACRDGFAESLHGAAARAGPRPASGGGGRGEGARPGREQQGENIPALPVSDWSS